MDKFVETPINMDFVKSFFTAIDPERPAYSKINITEELAEHLDGHCFIDLELPERLESVQFRKTDTGLTAEYCGTDGYGVAYYENGCDVELHPKMIDNYGEHILDDTYNGCTLYDVVFNTGTNREISVETHEHIKFFVQQQVKIKEANHNYIDTIRQIIIKNLQK